MKKTYKIVLVILLPVLIIFSIFGIQVYKFNSNIINYQIISDDESYLESTSSVMSEIKIIDKKGCFISKAYLTKYDQLMEIKFSYFNSDLFNEENMRTTTGYNLIDTNDNNLNYSINVYSDEYCGFNGLIIILKFKEKICIPKSGEKLFFTIGSSKDEDTELKKDKCFSYCEMELLIP